ncbi:MAG: hypothetical protein AB7N61_14995 [Acidimicrobiia bacterium]
MLPNKPPRLGLESNSPGLHQSQGGSPDVERETLARRLADFESFDTDQTLSRSAAKRWARQLEKERARLDTLKDAVEDPAVTYFDRMGVGMLVVDEAHLAKNIRLNTSRQGLPLPEGSQRAEAILARADYVRSRHGDGAIVMATATPITNSPAEMWVAARLVAPHALAEAGVEHFDAMAANFLAPVETVEHGADGKLKVVTRLGEYKNFPDLARMFRSFADVRPTSSLGFTLPDVDGGTAAVHVCEPTDQQMVVASWCAERAEARQIDKPDGGRDPVIAILSTARAAALHPATISVETCEKWATANHRHLRFDWDEPNHKLIAAADHIAAIHHRTAEWTYPDSDRPGATQVVFCDAGVPKPDGRPSVYSTLTHLLVERGIHRVEIAWVHDIAEPNRRQPLWDAVRSGHCRVLIGSTAQMGVGVNIQTRLYAAHELTAPYRPDWLEQAEGRLIRQGNPHPQVEVHRYVTERTADANSWQILRRKAHFITQAMSDPEQMTRDLRDESVASPAEEYATIAAIATGDQRHIELAALAATVTRLERAERAHHASRLAQDNQIRHAEHSIARLHTHVGAIDALRPVPGDPHEIGRQLLAVGWNTHTTVTLAGITYDAHRVDGLRLEIGGTGIVNRIEPDRLHPADGGRGLGQSVLNTHDRLDRIRTGYLEHADDARRQIDAEHARPVPAVFARAAELADCRQRRNQLQTALMPGPTRSRAGVHRRRRRRRPRTHTRDRRRRPSDLRAAPGHDRRTVRLGWRLPTLRPAHDRPLGQPRQRPRRVGRSRQRVQPRPRRLESRTPPRHRPIPRRQSPSTHRRHRHPHRTTPPLQPARQLPRLHHHPRRRRHRAPCRMAPRPTPTRHQRTRRPPHQAPHRRCASQPAPHPERRTMNPHRAGFVLPVNR